MAIGKAIIETKLGKELKKTIVVAYQYLASSYATQTNPQNSASSNDVVQLTLFIFVWNLIVFSHQNQ